jgi:indolepyruvate ferredoxin oxidoreductase alpha subunit
VTGSAHDLANEFISVATDQPSACTSEFCGDAVITVGDAYATVRDREICTMLVRAHARDPGPLVAFARRHVTTLVIEDSEPLVESLLRGRVGGASSIIGRLSGHLARHGALSTDDVDLALAGQRAQNPAPEAETRPPPQRYAALFEAVTALRKQGAFVATDVGSSVRLCYPPYDGADAALAVGSAVTVAGDAARSGRHALAVIGDFGLLHSGLPAVIDVAASGLPVVVVVLVNGIQATTGGQRVADVDLAPLLRACGMSVIEQWHADELDSDQTRARLTRLHRAGGPCVVLVFDGAGPRRS